MLTDSYNTVRLQNADFVTHELFRFNNFPTIGRREIPTFSEVSRVEIGSMAILTISEVVKKDSSHV